MSGVEAIAGAMKLVQTVWDTYELFKKCLDTNDAFDCLFSALERLKTRLSFLKGMCSERALYLFMHENTDRMVSGLMENVEARLLSLQSGVPKCIQDGETPNFARKLWMGLKDNAKDVEKRTKSLNDLKPDLEYVQQELEKIPKPPPRADIPLPSLTPPSMRRRQLELFETYEVPK